LVVVARFVSQPFQLSLSQLPKPALQEGALQAPLAHVEPVALALVQPWPHEPQLALLVWRLVSQPLARLASQSP
jgi:hypothetical protein